MISFAMRVVAKVQRLPPRSGAGEECHVRQGLPCSARFRGQRSTARPPWIPARKFFASTTKRMSNGTLAIR